MQTEKNIWLRMLSMILTLALMISCIPNQVYAMAGEALAELMEQEETAEVIETPNETKRDVYEVTELREANVKHFALEDGTYTAVMYGGAVHTQDAEGNWQDIDNRLSDSGSEFSTSNARIKFAKKITGNETLFTLHDGNRKITMSLDNAIKKTTGTVTNHTTEFDSEATQLQKLMTLDNLSSEILYADILDGVDLQYVVASLNVKENIIVKERKDSYQYTFTIALNNLEAEMAEDGSVRIYDPSTKETIYNIPAGFMYDANGEYSTAVVYALTNSGNGKYSLVVTADATWINAEERAFPVVIDPTVELNDSTSYESTHIHQLSPDANYNSVDYHSAGTQAITYWKSSATLPSIPSGYYITDAKFIAEQRAGSYGPLELGVYKVISNWNANTLTYAQYEQGNVGQFACSACDAVSEVNDKKQYIWNITQIIREWYNDPTTNYGLAIRCTTPNSSYNAFHPIRSGISGSPILITYKSIRGIEDYWSYATQSAGSAGTGYVNKATGELTFAIGTLSTIDALFGQTVSLVYNQAFAGKYAYVAATNIPFRNPTAGYGFKLNINEYLVSDTFVDALNQTRTYYIWTDADGTEHDFYPEDDSTTIFKDDDGLLLTLTVEDNEYHIEDMNHNVRTFKCTSTDGNTTLAGAILESITDKDGNQLKYIYSNEGRILQVQVIPNGSTAITYLALEYNDYGLIEQISNVGLDNAPKVKFYYSTQYYGGAATSPEYRGYLKKIEFLNNNQVVATNTYGYDSQGRLNWVYSLDSKYSLTYMYTGNQVQYVMEDAGADTTFGQTLFFTYGVGYTELKSSGSDDRNNTDDDLITVYIFDEYGRVTSTYTTDKNRTAIYGASSGEYETQDNVKNNIKTAMTIGGSSSNYIVNGGFEHLNEDSTEADCWYKHGNIVYGFSNSQEHDNYQAVFNITANKVCRLKQRVVLPEGSYTFSVDVDATNAKGVNTFICAQSLNSSERRFTMEVPMDESNVVDGWTTVTLNFDAQNLNNSGGEMFEIIVAAEFTQFPGDRVGTILVDNVMLEEGSVYSGYSMVEFGNFEDYSVTWLNYHKRTFENYWKTNFNVVYEDELLGNVLMVDPSIENGEVEATQTIYEAIEGQEDLCPKTFIISGMAKGTQQYASGDFCVQLYVVPKNGDPKTYDLKFQSDCNVWQFASKTITLEEDEIAQIDLRIIYNNPGVAYFDNIFVTQVLKNGVINREYYEDGRLEEQGNEEYWERYKYDVRGNLIEVVNSRYELYEYSYDDNNQLYQDQYSIEYPEDHLLGYQKNTLRATEYGYNSAGQMIRAITYAGGIPAAGAKDVLQISYRYTYDTEPGSRTFGVLLEERDSLNHLTKYFYDPINGLLQAVINTESKNGTCYTYDLLGNITSVMQASYTETGEYDPVLDGAEITYEYNEAALLDTITTPSTAYRFTYDVFGKTEAVSVGNQQIVDYDYNAKNGKLTAIHYGNGFTVQYVYDELENISKVCYIEGDQTTDAYLYHYNAYGQMQRFENLLSGKGILYQYDSYHQLIGYSEYDIAEGTQDFSAAIMYDDNSQISGAEYRFGYVLNNAADKRIGSILYTFSYNDDGTIKDCRIQSGAVEGTITYSYDQFGRVSSKNYDYSDSETGVGFSQSFQYNFTSPGYFKTSDRIENLVTRINSGPFYNYTFSYDDDGNITKISTQDYEYRYQYDDLGQLLREDNTAHGKTYVYEYDAAGNIIKKETYALTAEGATPTILETTYDYGYGDADWGDKLKSYRSGAISYDEIGNPLSYFNGTRWNFTWEHGRRLSEANGNGYQLFFTYNDEGIRTTKTVNGVVHTYRLNGSQIVAEEWATAEDDGTTVEHMILFLYDAEGAPVGMQYRNQTYAPEIFDVYWYEKNLQGDIVAVYDNDGTPLIFYYYDAWGNIKTEHSDNWSASSTANLNPFLYRGYYYDSELEMYYLQSRYYDPVIGRFLTADKLSTLNASPFSTTDKNLFAYCDNNPVMRKDDGGMFWETVFDIVSLAVSVVEVVQNPKDPLAWAGVIGDAIDLIPFVSGVGEVTRAVTTGMKVADTIDDVHDASKVADNIFEAGKTVIEKFPEQKLPNQIKLNDVTDAWDEFLGPNQTSINRFTGQYDPNRIFSADGTRSVRFGNHEMDSLGTTKAHFHYELWDYDSLSNTVYVSNFLQRLKRR